MIKAPLYALLIAPDAKVRKAVLKGSTNTSIREGHREYPRDGKIMLCWHLDPWTVMADITRTVHVPLCRVSAEEWQAAGYQSQADLLHGMRRFYPKMILNSQVTIISWNNLSGTLFEAAEREKALNGKRAKVTCDKCKKPALWVRRTEFAGEHFFCDQDARAEKDFGNDDSDLFVWQKLQ